MGGGERPVQAPRRFQSVPPNLRRPQPQLEDQEERHGLQPGADAPQQAEGDQADPGRPLPLRQHGGRGRLLGR